MITSPRWILRRAVGLYRKVSRFLMPPSCRFHPSCSEYAALALDRHSLCRALRLISGRLLRCHPWHAGGCDPVPNA
ncbi:MAG: membrane protein insertion efficiency factor YidD [Elusimicrobia bacterium]|nr:membrane protein insertion efficiency factor YidD [Elusimicrobiota bacterium]